ncbi:MAG: AAA family ATPase [Phycisphaerales bacterium]
MTDARDAIARLRESVGRVFLGHAAVLDDVLVCLLARGHLLIEDVPGVGKTVLASAVAKSIDCSFSRLQMTPDMLPSDVLGVSVYNRATESFEFKKGPIFANIVLADEINRTTPRTQTALLEAMNESSVSVEGVVHTLPQPFMVLATQNPYEFEGTYLLPENQLDRFLMRVRIGYPGADDEARVIEQRPAQTLLRDMAPVIHGQDVVMAQARVDQIRLDRSLVEYIVQIARATREHESVRVGLSPRGSQALAQAARATALVEGREYVVPEDILTHVQDVCAHRLITRASLGESDEEAAGILREIVERVPSPV